MRLVPSGSGGKKARNLATIQTFDQIKTLNQLEVSEDFLPAAVLLAADSAPLLHFVSDVVEAHGGAERPTAAGRVRRGL